VTLDTSDNPFKIKADITVVYPNGDENLLVGTDEPITWTVVGTVPNVRLEYSMDDFAGPVPITRVITTMACISGTNTYLWRVPDDISAGKITKVRVVDTLDDNSYDKSGSGFRIKGWFDVTSPAIGDTYLVGRKQPITWTSFGTMPTVKLEYSLDNFTGVTNTIEAAISNFYGVNSYLWTVPDDITPDDRVKVRVTTVEPDDPEINDVSVGFKIRADIQVISPHGAPSGQSGAERWISNELHNITWVITGTVPFVTIYYSCSVTFDAGIQLVISDTPSAAGYYNWKVPDRPLELQLGPLDKTKVRICDSRDLTSLGQSPDFFKIDYYNITFNVKDSVTNKDMTAMTYMDAIRGLTIYPFSSPRAVGYPYGTNYQSILSKATYAEVSVENWAAESDRTFYLKMDSSVVHNWQIPVDFKYDPANNSLLATSWFLMDGLVPEIVTEQGTVVLTNCRIDIYDEGANLVHPLESDNVDITTGRFTILWEDTNLLPETTYFAKVTMTYNGTDYHSALTYNINVPTKLQAIQQATAGLAGQMTVVVSNTSQTAADTTQIRADTESIRTTMGSVALIPDITEKLTKVSESLGENVTDVINMVGEQVATQFKKGILSEILTRYTVVKSGETVSIRYRVLGKGLMPVIDVYDNNNTRRVAGAVMTEISSPDDTEGGIYQYNLTFLTGWGKGEFTIICSESTTKAMDSMVVTVIATSLEDIDTATKVIVGSSSQQKDVTTALSRMESNLGTIIASVNTIPKSTAEGKIDPVLLNQMNNGISSVLKQLKDFAGSRGYNFDSIVQTINTSQEGSIKEMINKMARLEQLQRISNQILERTEQKFLIDLSYEWGSIKIKIVVVNKSDEPQQVEVRKELPPELRPEDVLEKGNFEVGYDPEKAVCFIWLPVSPTLEARGTERYEIKVNDVWTIPNNQLQNRNEVGEGYLKQLKNENKEKGEWLMGDIQKLLNDIIKSQQARESMPVEKYITLSRDNKEKMAQVDNYLNILRGLVYPELAQSEFPFSMTGFGKFGAGAGLKKGGGEGDKSLGITAEKSWLVILIVLAFLGILSAVFFFIWQSHLKKARVSPELAEISPESVQMPEVGKSGEEKK